MGFAHLPVEGGLYDQHPDLLSQWEIIFSIKGQEEKRKREKREREMRNKTKGAKR